MSGDAGEKVLGFPQQASSFCDSTTGTPSQNQCLSLGLACALQRRSRPIPTAEQFVPPLQGARSTVTLPLRCLCGKETKPCQTKRFAANKAAASLHSKDAPLSRSLLPLKEDKSTALPQWSAGDDRSAKRARNTGHAARRRLRARSSRPPMPNATRNSTTISDSSGAAAGVFTTIYSPLQPPSVLPAV